MSMWVTVMGLVWVPFAPGTLLYPGSLGCHTPSEAQFHHAFPSRRKPLINTQLATVLACLVAAESALWSHLN